MERIKLKIGDIVEVEGRLLKVSAGRWANQSEWVMKKDPNKLEKDWRGYKITLKVLREKELNELILKDTETKQLEQYADGLFIKEALEETK